MAWNVWQFHGYLGSFEVWTPQTYPLVNVNKWKTMESHHFSSEMILDMAAPDWPFCVFFPRNNIDDVGKVPSLIGFLVLGGKLFHLGFP